MTDEELANNLRRAWADARTAKDEASKVFRASVAATKNRYNDCVEQAKEAGLDVSTNWDHPNQPILICRHTMKEL